MTKKTLKSIAIILAIVTALGAVGFVSGLVVIDQDKSDEYFARKVNEDNLYQSATVTLVDSNDGRGISVDVNEKNGVITLNGNASEDITLTVGTVTLEAGEYTLTAIKNGGLNSIYMSAGAVNFDFTPDNVLKPTSTTTYTLTIVIKEGTELKNLAVMPIIASGTESVEYFQ